MAAQTIPVRVGDIEVLIETVTVVGSQATSGVDRLTAQVAGAFERAQQVIEEIAAQTAATIARTAERAARPDQIEVEFGLKISAKGDVIVAGAAGEASLRTKLTYRTGSASGPAAES